MKKIALLLAIVLLGTGSFAANVPVKKFGFGAQGLTLTTGAITLPTIQYYLNENMAFEGGFAYITQGAGGASVSNYTLMFALKNKLMQTDNQINPFWGVGLAYVNNPALVSGATLMVLALNFGAEYFMAPQLSIEGNISPISYAAYTRAGVTTTSISILNSNVVPAAVIGAHFYL